VNAVVTICIGSDYHKIGSVTHPLIKDYANKIGAEFIVIDKKEVSQEYPPYEKFQIYKLLNTYERILFLDTDLIIRRDCPDIFALVPQEKIGLFNEGTYIDRSAPIAEAAKQYNTPIPKWCQEYYNTGVMVVSRVHKFLFKPPTLQVCNFYEQSYLNLQILSNKTSVFPLSHDFNRMTVMDQVTGKSRLASYIVHYAGCPDQTFMIDLIKKDIKSWDDSKDLKYPMNILFKVHGGLGDQVCAEPIIRHMVEGLYKDENMIIETWFPRLFDHISCKIVQMGAFKPDPDTPYYVMNSMVNPEHQAWLYLSANLMHTTDFISCLNLRKILPNVDKEIKLQINKEDIQEVEEICGLKSLQNFVLIHPGKGWKSKTFPTQYWSDIVKSLVDKGLKVAIIGKHVSDEQGTVDLDLPEGVLDLRNLLSLGGLMAAISQAPVLITNDSAPVHIAGAFDNVIILIPTCKHPDWVLPFRNGSNTYKSHALYKQLMADAYDSRPTNIVGETIDNLPGEYEAYLPDVSQIVAKVSEVLTQKTI
jgi:hypothetical protein